MRPRPKDLSGSCACSPFDAIIARIEALEQRAAAIVSSVEGIPPDGTGNVNLPNSSEIGDALYGRMDAFTMSSVAKAINDELNALLTRIGAFDFAGTDGRITAATEAIEQIEAELESYEARITAVEDDIISINAHIHAVELDYVQKVGDTMTGPLRIPDGTVSARNDQAVNANTVMADLDAYEHMVRTSGNQHVGGIKTFTKITYGTVTSIHSNSTAANTYSKAFSVALAVGKRIRFRIAQGYNNADVQEATLEMGIGSSTPYLVAIETVGSTEECARVSNYAVVDNGDGTYTIYTKKVHRYNTLNVTPINESNYGAGTTPDEYTLINEAVDAFPDNAIIATLAGYRNVA